MVHMRRATPQRVPRRRVFVCTKTRRISVVGRSSQGVEWRAKNFIEVSGPMAELLHGRLLRTVLSPLSKCRECGEVHIETLYPTEDLNERRIDCESCGTAGRLTLWEPAQPHTSITTLFVPCDDQLELLEFSSREVTQCGFHILSGLCDVCYAPEPSDDGIPFCIVVDDDANADACWVELYKFAQCKK